MPTYSPGEVAKMLDISAPTLRRYVATFGEYLSDDARRQRSRYFSDADISVIAQIRNLTAQGLKIKEIPAHLGEIVKEDRPLTALELPGLQRQIETIFESFQDQQKDINTLRQELEQLKRDRSRSWLDRLLGRK